MERPGSMTQDEIDRYADMAEELLRNQYDSNRSALARAIGFQPSNITGFLKRQRGLSSKYSQRLCELAGKPYPLPARANGRPSSPPMTSPAVSVSTPPPPERTVPVAPTPRNLSGIIELFGADYLHATAAAAIGSFDDGVVDMSARDWLVALGDLDKMMRGWVAERKKAPQGVDP